MKRLLGLLMGAALLVAVQTVWADDMAGMNMGTTTTSKKVTLTGTLVDIACYVEDGSAGNDHGDMKACGAKCLEGGSPAGLLVGKKLYTLAFPASAFQDYAGQKVEVGGTLYLDQQLIPQQAFAIKNGKKREIQIKGKAMM